MTATALDLFGRTPKPVPDHELHRWLADGLDRRLRRHQPDITADELADWDRSTWALFASVAGYRSVPVPAVCQLVIDRRRAAAGGPS